MTTGGSPTAGRLIERGASELSRAGIDDARFQAELLLRHALGWSREALLARLQEPVPAEGLGHFIQLLEKRRGRVPVQYLLGVQEFYGLSFRVTPAVLIPRPETEGVVEEALGELEGTESPRIADVGCGSGCIAIALLHERRDATGLAIDSSPAAIAAARDNAVRHEVAHRLQFIEGDLLSEPPADGLDCIVSNPPYIPDEDIAGLEPEVAEHEPRSALAGGPDGLDVIRRLVPQAAAALRPGGSLVLEVGHDQASRVESLLSESGLEPNRTVSDLQSIPRVVVARRR